MDNRTVHKTFALLSALLLGACGGGGSDSHDAPSTPSGAVSGIVFDSQVYNGTVSVLTSGGQTLASTTTDGNGDYRAGLQVDSQPVFLRVASGEYLEDATLNAIGLDGNTGLVLRSVDFYQAGDDLNLSVTFFTTLASGLVEFLVQNQGLSTEVAIERAYAEIDAWAGFNTRRTRPVAVFNVANASPFLTDSIKAGFVAAGISELTRVVGVNTNGSQHTTYTSISFIKLAYEDVKADGVLDGQGSGGQLTFGNLTITGDTYRTLLATRLLQYGNSNYNQTSLDFNDLVDYASDLNLYAGELFNYTTAVDIKETKATVGQFLPAQGAVIYGGINASAIVSDPFGLLSVRYYMDGNFVASAPNPYLPIRSIDTLSFANGQHTLRIDVQNFFGNITSVTHTVTINN